MQISASCASKSSCAGEIGLVGGDDGKVEVIGKIEQQGLDRPLLRQPMALKLDIEPVAEDALQRFEPRAGELGIACRRARGRSTLRARR